MKRSDKEHKDFKEWLSDNFTSESLHESYANHRLEMKQCGLPADSFIQWARQVWKANQE